MLCARKRLTMRTGEGVLEYRGTWAGILSICLVYVVRPSSALALGMRCYGSLDVDDIEGCMSAMTRGTL